MDPENASLRVIPRCWDKSIGTLQQLTKWAFTSELFYTWEFTQRWLQRADKWRKYF